VRGSRECCPNRRSGGQPCPPWLLHAPSGRNHPMEKLRTWLSATPFHLGNTPLPLWSLSLGDGFWSRSDRRKLARHEVPGGRLESVSVPAGRRNSSVLSGRAQCRISNQTLRIWLISWAASRLGSNSDKLHPKRARVLISAVQPSRILETLPPLAVCRGEQQDLRRWLEAVFMSGSVGKRLVAGEIPVRVRTAR